MVTPQRSKPVRCHEFTLACAPYQVTVAAKSI